MNYCPNCGHKIEEGWNYCVFCGERVITTPGYRTVRIVEIPIPVPYPVLPINPITLPWSPLSLPYSPPSWPTVICGHMESPKLIGAGNDISSYATSNPNPIF